MKAAISICVLLPVAFVILVSSVKHFQDASLQGSPESNRKLKSYVTLMDAIREMIKNEGAESLNDFNDGSGNPSVSWLVKLLPYVGHEGLREKFSTTEPWDSPANQKLFAKMPPELSFLGTQEDAESGLTYFVQCKDAGTSEWNAVLAETAQPRPWTMPSQFVSRKDVGSLAGKISRNGIYLGTFGGSVFFEPKAPK